MNNLVNMSTKKELYAKAKAMDLPLRSKMTKEQLKIYTNKRSQSIAKKRFAAKSKRPVQDQKKTAKLAKSIGKYNPRKTDWPGVDTATSKKIATGKKPKAKKTTQKTKVKQEKPPAPVKAVEDAAQTIADAVDSVVAPTAAPKSAESQPSTKGFDSRKAFEEYQKEKQSIYAQARALGIDQPEFEELRDLQKLIDQAAMRAKEEAEEIPDALTSPFEAIAQVFTGAGKALGLGGEPTAEVKREEIDTAIPLFPPDDNDAVAEEEAAEAAAQEEASEAQARAAAASQGAPPIPEEMSEPTAPLAPRPAFAEDNLVSSAEGFRNAIRSLNSQQTRAMAKAMGLNAGGKIGTVRMRITKELKKQMDEVAHGYRVQKPNRQSGTR